MFYRRKVIFALLQSFEGKLEKNRLQELLFLFCINKEKAEYDFVPYKPGCFSFSANADLIVMVKRVMLTETNDYFISNEKTDYINSLKDDDQKLMAEIIDHYGKMNDSALMKYIYSNYPFYAINSATVQNVLTKNELKNVNECRPKNLKTILYTIGYEGISLEEYLSRLIKNDIKILVDVRNSPLSMKYGFNKGQLKLFCENLGLQYMHFPEVGVPSDKRQELNTQVDYDKLFDSYCKNSLPKTKPAQMSILALIKQHKRIALTCFEANIDQCHRKHLANAIEALHGFEYEVIHI